MLPAAWCVSNGVLQWTMSPRSWHQTHGRYQSPIWARLASVTRVDLLSRVSWPVPDCGRQLALSGLQRLPNLTSLSAPLELLAEQIQYMHLDNDAEREFRVYHFKWEVVGYQH